MENTHASRLIVLDTETTGLSTKDGNRILEIGCVELIDRRLTGNNFHVYINPQRESEEGALRVHGITSQFLADKPTFSQIAPTFLDYIRGAELIIHNAPFDVGFLNYELVDLLKFAPIESICTIFDTLEDAKKRHPSQRNNLDALCKRYNVDNTHRELHGALLDAQILADVFLAMTGGQFSLMNENENAIQNITASTQNIIRVLGNRAPLPVLRCIDEELQAHEARLDSIKNSLWRTN
ncbi:MAG: DNA polymerase III subunit epsilon [Methylococcaceae bacterium]